MPAVPSAQYWNGAVGGYKIPQRTQRYLLLPRYDCGNPRGAPASLHRVEEALCHCIVPTISFATHRTLNAVFWRASPGSRLPHGEWSSNGCRNTMKSDRMAPSTK